MARAYLKDHPVTTAGDDICEPKEENTHWSADLTHTTVALHHLKSTEEWAKGWTDMWPHIVAARAGHYNRKHSRNHRQARQLF